MLYFVNKMRKIDFVISCHAINFIEDLLNLSQAFLKYMRRD